MMFWLAAGGCLLDCVLFFAFGAPAFLPPAAAFGVAAFVYWMND